MNLKDYQGWDPKQGDYNEHASEMHRANARINKQRKRSRILVTLGIGVALVAFWFWMFYSGKLFG